jgi:hypothetical protein
MQLVFKHPTLEEVTEDAQTYVVGLPDVSADAHVVVELTKNNAAQHG